MASAGSSRRTDELSGDDGHAASSEASQLATLRYENERLRAAMATSAAHAKQWETELAVSGVEVLIADSICGGYGSVIVSIYKEFWRDEEASEGFRFTSSFYIYIYRLSFTAHHYICPCECMVSHTHEQTLKNNNARLTAALQDSAANVEEWKTQVHLS